MRIVVAEIVASLLQTVLGTAGFAAGGYSGFRLLMPSGLRCGLPAVGALFVGGGLGGLLGLIIGSAIGATLREPIRGWIAPGSSPGPAHSRPNTRSTAQQPRT
jgi:hypothetical protein